MPVLHHSNIKYSAFRTRPSIAKAIASLVDCNKDRHPESRKEVVDNNGHEESGIQAQLRPSANVKEIKPARQRPSDRPSNKSTWEILLNNSDIEPLLHNVSLE